MTGLTVAKERKMTEMEQGSVQSFDNSNNSVPVSSPSPAPQAPATSEERTFRQHEVNDLIGRAKSEAVERFKRESSLASHQQQHQPSQINAQTTAGLSHDEVRRMAAEEAQRLRDQWIEEANVKSQQQDAQRIAGEFFQKIDAGKSKYQDYDSVMKDVDFGAIPHIVQVANMMENTADVMYELGKNPGKIGIIQQLLNISPSLAMAEMKKLSQSIKDNSEAQSFRHPNEPLSQLRPSNQGMDNKGALNVSDYKRKYLV